MAPNQPQQQPHAQSTREIGEGLDLLGCQLAEAAKSLRDLLDRAGLFGGEYGYVRCQLLTLLNSLGLHEGTVRQLRRVVDRRAVDSRAGTRDRAR